MSQTAVQIWLCEEDATRLKAIGIPLEWAGESNTDAKPKIWKYNILETIYQQLKIYCTSGAYGGMTLETFLRTVNDTTTQGGQCTTTNTTSST